MNEFLPLIQMTEDKFLHLDRALKRDWVRHWVGRPNVQTSFAFGQQHLANENILKLNGFMKGAQIKPDDTS